jgi:hypothetical protein
MAVFFEGGGGRSLIAETESFGLLTEGAAGVAVVVLAIIGLSHTQPGILAAIATIVVGVGLMVQGFNTAAEYSRLAPSSAAVGAATPGQAAAMTAGVDVSGEVMTAFAAGLAGIVLGILGLLAIHTEYLIPAAVIVFGADLLLAGSLGIGRGSVTVTAQPGQPGAQAVTQSAGSTGALGLGIMIGVAAVVLGILSIVLAATMAATAAVLALVALLAIGAGLLVVSASFGGAVSRLFAATA